MEEEIPQMLENDEYYTLELEEKISNDMIRILEEKCRRAK